MQKRKRGSGDASVGFLAVLATISGRLVDDPLSSPWMIVGYFSNPPLWGIARPPPRLWRTALVPISLRGGEVSSPISFFHRLLPSNLSSSPSLNLLPNEMNRRSKSLPSTLCAILLSLDPLFRRFFSPFDEIKRGASETGCFFPSKKSSRRKGRIFESTTRV